MMTATPNDVCLTAHWANIASLRNEVEQHHFERSEKHHIAAGDASFDMLTAYFSVLLAKYGAFSDVRKICQIAQRAILLITGCRCKSFLSFSCF